jgi:SRSO17 transposase
MSVLRSPQAQVLLDDASIEPDTIRFCRSHLTSFLDRYLPLFYRKEQGDNAEVVLKGLLSDLERKTCEPIARREGVQRKPIQFFVGTGKWDDEAVMAEYRLHVAQEFGDPYGVLIIDPSAFPKKGIHSCGVKRQWCGRLGKIENCQVGVFLSYATNRGCAFLDRRLFLPEDWAEDPSRRKKTHVPPDVVFRTKWQIALDMLDAHASEIPHAWIIADEDFGRTAEFRSQLRARCERYILDVPCDTSIRDLEVRRPPRRRRGVGRMKETPFRRVDEWLKRQPPSRWERFRVSDGEKGPLEVQAMAVRVRTLHEEKIGDEERLLVIRTMEDVPRIRFALSNAEREVPLAELVRVACQRHRIEELFEVAKGEAGLDEYEVRSWVGWHHHITLSMLALWFLTLERRRLGGKNPGSHGSTNAKPLLATAS